MADEGSKAVAGGELGRLPGWPRKPLNNSVIAAEQAYRKRSGLPLISDADVAATKAAGVSEDEIFELTVCAALGQATRQLDAALAALDAASTAGVAPEQAPPRTDDGATR